METLKPRYLEIADKLEFDIVAGRLKHGERLPNTKELSALFGVSIPTVQQGLGRLVDKGLLKRSPKLGSHVDASSLSRRYAVVFGWSPFEIDSRFYALLMKGLIEGMDAASINFDLHVGLLRERFELRGRQFIESASAGSYACAIVLDLSAELSAWCKTQELIACVEPPGFDIKESARLGVSYLLERGAKRVAMVSMVADVFMKDGAKGFERELEGAAQAFSDYGRPFDPSILLHWDQTMRDGYERTKELMASPSRPDGLFINHDVLTKGALPALMESSIRIPQDLVFATHANKGDDFLTAYPVAKVEADPAKFASVTLDYIRENAQCLKPGIHKAGGLLRPELSLAEGRK